MKWIVLAVVLALIFAFFRRMNRESVVGYWQQRPEVPFDEFYVQYYSKSGLDKEAVRMALQMVARATDVPATRLRPEDRIDELKPGALKSALALLQRILDTGMARNAGMQQPTSWKADTVDDVIRLIAPYYDHLRVTAD